MTFVEIGTGVVLCAALFILFGLLRPVRGECSSDCGSCTGACPRGDRRS